MKERRFNMYEQKKKAVRLGFLALLIVVCYWISRDNYPGLILSYITIYSIATTGLDILFGYSGQISFGHAAFFAIGAYTTAILSTRLKVPPFLGILLGCAFAAGLGIVIAFPASKLVKHFLSLLTIAFGQMVYMFVNSTTALTGGAGGISGIPALCIFGIAIDNNSRFFLFSTGILALVLLLKKRMIASRTGRALIAIRENVHAAQGLGINVRNYKLLAFAVSAALAGLAGGLYAHLGRFISPETFNATQSTLFMTMLLFGGIATSAGPVVGTAILIIIKEVFQSLAQYQTLVYGIFILLVLFFLPNGMVGLFVKVKAVILNLMKRRCDNAAAG